MSDQIWLYEAWVTFDKKERPDVYPNLEGFSFDGGFYFFFQRDPHRLEDPVSVIAINMNSPKVLKVKIVPQILAPNVDRSKGGE